ncbi:MAG: hypothetical protein OIN87_11785 [Candidatus Methanoperedens sp.]|nr:hypothetical protein [Candidatus Methanoperedens sp.]
MINSSLYEEQTFKIWKELFEKANMIFQGDINLESYKELCSVWSDKYKSINNKCDMPFTMSKTELRIYVENSEAYLAIYKAWINALEKVSEKAKELSFHTSDPEALREFNDLWIKMYGKAFDTFFEDMPTLEGPMREVMGPATLLGKIYTDSLILMMRKHTASAAPA